MKLQKKKKQVPLFGKSREEEAGEIQGNRLVSIISFVPSPILHQQYIAGHLKNGLTVTVEFDLH